MQRLNSWFLGLAATLLPVAPLVGQPVIDGRADAAYGAALSIQNTQTQFGDNRSDDLVDTEQGGSEIDQVFGRVANDGTKDRLYLMFAGNLENNFNKLEIFIDVDGSAGGVHTINGAELPTQVDGYCCTIGGNPNVNLPDPTRGALQQKGVSGLSFDAEFFADYYLTISSGGEGAGEGASDLLRHWAVTAHYAELTKGVAGRVVAAGMQLAPQGLPSTLRAPLAPDFDRDFDVDGDDFLTWQREIGQGTQNNQGDADRDGDVDSDDFSATIVGWDDRFGDQPGFNDFPYNPSPEIPTATLLQHAPSLPGLGQGELIDKNYAQSVGQCTTDATDGDAGCLAPELDFVLPVDSNDLNNALNHRNMENSIDLRLALDNSNIAGVEGGSGEILTGDPENVLTGIELSIPLDQLLDANGNLPNGSIRVTAYINGTGHDFASNQWSGEGIRQGNVGALDFVPYDLELDAPGEQFVTIAQPPAGASAVPEPSILCLSLVAAACRARGRRR